MKRINDLENLAKKYRRELFEKLLIIKQGHLGSIYSMMETVVTLYHCGFVKYDEKRKKFLDKVLISKGHATAALYPILRDFGLVKEKDWNDWGHKSSLLRVFGNISIPGIDVTSGSLGHCVGVGAGMAISYKRAQKDKITGLGIKVLEVDGHNINDLISTFETSKKLGELNCILAKTIKGKGCSLMENEKHWHYYNHLSEEEIKQVRKELS